jgi:LacI family transcriptional regulator
MTRVTSNDIAAKAGISRTTVSLVLNNVAGARISEATRAKILQIAKELDYKPNQLARGLKTNRSRTIAFMLPSISNPFYPYVAQGIEDVALAHGYTVFICNTYRDFDKEKNYYRTLAQRQVDGLILSGSTKSSEFLQEFIDLGVAVTTFNPELDFPTVDQVLVDNVHGGFLATQHLLEYGHRRIAFLAEPLVYQSRNERLEGYKKAFDECGLKVDESLILRSASEFEYHDQTYDLFNGYNLGKRLLKETSGVTAVVANNDMTAMGAFKALCEEGVGIPGDISIVGYDNIPMAGMLEPGLTTIDQPKYERGKAAAELLIKRLMEPEGGERRIIKFLPSLITRESCCRLSC